MADDRFRPDAALLPLLPRFSCVLCDGEPEPCDDCARAMVADLARAVYDLANVSPDLVASGGVEFMTVSPPCESFSRPNRFALGGILPAGPRPTIPLSGEFVISQTLAERLGLLK